MLYHVDKQSHPGRCRSCALKGNTKRLLAPYDPALFKSSIYRAWSNMKTRCTNTKIADYPRYGGRGITVCENWQTFAGFAEDMLSTYQEGLTLDRVDNNSGYSRENCRWVTARDQANNRRSNRLFTLNGQTATLEEWIRLRGLKSSTVRGRFYCLHWSIERSLEMQVCGE